MKGFRAENIHNPFIATIAESNAYSLGDKITPHGAAWYIAPFVNAERPQYLVVEDRFPNGRPALEKAGVYLTDRDTVNCTERMKVTTCLNPLHTALRLASYHFRGNGADRLLYHGIPFSASGTLPHPFSGFTATILTKINCHLTLCHTSSS